MSTPYSDIARLNIDAERLMQLTENPTRLGVRDDALILSLGLDANDIIDTKLRGKWIVPFDPVPSTIERLHRWILKYLLYSHRETMEMPVGVLTDYKNALKELDALGDTEGGTILDAPRVIAASPPTPAGGALDPTLTRVFGRKKDSLGG